MDGWDHFAAVPTAVYGGVLLAAAIAYYVLERTLIRAEGPLSQLKVAVGRDLKGKISPVLYAAAIPLAFLSQWAADALYVVVALIWLVPNRRNHCPARRMTRGLLPETRRGVPA